MMNSIEHYEFARIAKEQDLWDQAYIAALHSRQSIYESHETWCYKADRFMEERKRRLAKAVEELKIK